MSRLLVISATFDPTLGEIAPSVGSEGNYVEIVGLEFADDSEDADIEVYVDDVLVDADNVRLLNETRIRFILPAHADGLATIRVVFPSGVEKTLTDAITYQASLAFLSTDGDDYLVTESGDFLTF